MRHQVSGSEARRRDDVRFHTAVRSHACTSGPRCPYKESLHQIVQEKRRYTFQLLAWQGARPVGRHRRCTVTATTPLLTFACRMCSRRAQKPVKQQALARVASTCPNSAAVLRCTARDGAAGSHRSLADAPPDYSRAWLCMPGGL